MVIRKVDMGVTGKKMSYNIYYGAVTSDSRQFSNPNPPPYYHFKGVITPQEG